MFIQDWLTLKVLRAKNNLAVKLKHGDKIMYEINGKKYIGTIIAYECEYKYDVNFLYKLNKRSLERFYSLDKKAKNKFEEIKHDLKLVFGDSKFITSKFNLYGTLYIYFFSTNKIYFMDFFDDIKKIIGSKFFLYQVGIRDSVRLNPISKEFCGDCGGGLCCVDNLCHIASVKNKTILLQNIHTQNVEKQRGLCSSLKCCLKYEEKIYKEDIKKYPPIGTKIKGKKEHVIGINILSDYIFIKSDDGLISKISLNDYNIKKG